MHKGKFSTFFASPGLVFLAFIVGMLTLAACGGGQSGDLAVGDEAPGFSLQASDGRTVSLDDYVGKQPVLLYFHMAVG